MNNTNVVVIQGRLCWDPRVRTLLKWFNCGEFHDRCQYAV